MLDYCCSYDLSASSQTWFVCRLLGLMPRQHLPHHPSKPPPRSRSSWAPPPKHPPCYSQLTGLSLHLNSLTTTSHHSLLISHSCHSSRLKQSSQKLSSRSSNCFSSRSPRKQSLPGQQPHRSSSCRGSMSHSSSCRSRRRRSQGQRRGSRAGVRVSRATRLSWPP